MATDVCQLCPEPAVDRCGRCSAPLCAAHAHDVFSRCRTCEEAFGRTLEAQWKSQQWAVRSVPIFLGILAGLKIAWLFAACATPIGLALCWFLARTLTLSPAECAQLRGAFLGEAIPRALALPPRGGTDSRTY